MPWGYNSEGGSNRHSNHTDHMVSISSLFSLCQVGIILTLKDSCDTLHGWYYIPEHITEQIPGYNLDTCDAVCESLLCLVTMYEWWHLCMSLFIYIQGCSRRSATRQLELWPWREWIHAILPDWRSPHFDAKLKCGSLSSKKKNCSPSKISSFQRQKRLRFQTRNSTTIWYAPAMASSLMCSCTVTKLSHHFPIASPSETNTEISWQRRGGGPRSNLVVLRWGFESQMFQAFLTHRNLRILLESFVVCSHCHHWIDFIE